jgi:hypothetical protein
MVYPFRNGFDSRNSWPSRPQDPRKEQVQDHGEVLAGPHDLGPIAGGVLAELEAPGAVLEKRAVALRQIQRGTKVERGQVGQHLGRRFALGGGQGIEPSE